MSPKKRRGAATAPDDLDRYNRLLELLADRVRTVAMRYQTGAYLVGRPGSGKTHTVRRVLDEMEADYVLLNGRITPAALYEEIEERPNSTIVIDDVPTLFANLHAAQILMAAIGGPSDASRRVTYDTKRGRRITEFSGGIIAISNRPLQRDPASLALASRMSTLEHEPTDDMLVAFMRHTAEQGVEGVSPRESQMVCEHVIRVCQSGDYRVDLRHYFKGIADFKCWKTGTCKTDWQILVQSSMRRVDPDDLPASPRTRAETKAAEHEVVRQLHERRLRGEMLEAEWTKQTGKSLDSYYRRKRELRL